MTDEQLNKIMQEVLSMMDKKYNLANYEILEALADTAAYFCATCPSTSIASSLFINYYTKAIEAAEKIEDKIKADYDESA